MNKKILLIEDNNDMRENTAEILELANYEVEVAENGKVGVKKAKVFLPDLIICDIMMPELDGYEVLYMLSKDENTAGIPFVFLTAKADSADFRKGMNLGADDYITKPFSQRLLIERIRAILRRSKARAQADSGTQSKSGSEDVIKSMKRGRLRLDVDRHECLWDGEIVNLTITEFYILQSLAARPGFVKSRDALMDAAYDEQIYVDDRTIDSHIKRLRRKFKAVAPDFDAIETLYGVGYRFREG